jgi:hypothetical protein
MMDINKLAKSIVDKTTKEEKKEKLLQEKQH